MLKFSKCDTCCTFDKILLSPTCVFTGRLVYGCGDTTTGQLKKLINQAAYTLTAF